MLGAIEKPFAIAGHSIKVSGSIGITLFPTDDASADTLIRHADQAMYHAKNAGSGLFHLYDSVHDRKIRVRRETLAAFDLALQQGQLVLHYQPRIELRSGRVVGVEALVRWQHPENGLLMPGGFLPDLEGEPQEIALGEWVLRHGLEQHVRWRARGIKMPVSINVSPKHLQSKGFVPFLRELFGRYPEGTARQIELEVLETAAIDDPAEVADTMRAVAELGVRFSLDDFGTGYSSLTYFHRLPIDVLKIDQSFVRDMIDDPRDMDIVEGVLRLSEALRRPVVAEGVETIELGFLLLFLGCQYAQGYGISRPLPAAGFERWLEGWSEENIWRQLGNGTDASDGDFDLRVAMFSHQRWLDMIMQTLKSGGAERPPVLDLNGCQFSRWYRGIGRARYADRPMYPFIPPRHAKLHELVDALLDDLAQGRDEDLEGGLQRLQALSDDLMGMLRRLQAPGP